MADESNFEDIGDKNTTTEVTEFPIEDEFQFEFTPSYSKVMEEEALARDASKEVLTSNSGEESSFELINKSVSAIDHLDNSVDFVGDGSFHGSVAKESEEGVLIGESDSKSDASSVSSDSSISRRLIAIRQQKVSEEDSEKLKAVMSSTPRIKVVARKFNIPISVQLLATLEAETWVHCDVSDYLSP
jgi:hypothetical protein